MRLQLLIQIFNQSMRVCYCVPQNATVQCATARIAFLLTCANRFASAIETHEEVPMTNMTGRVAQGHAVQAKISHGLPLVSSMRIFNHSIASHIFVELNLSTRAISPSSSQFE